MSVFKSFSLMSIFTFLSRILGYARDLLFAFIFGASSSADSFLLAFRLPNLFRRLFAEGAISNAIVPLYLDIKKKSNQKAAQYFYNSVFSYLIIILVTVTILAEIFMKDIISFLAPGFTNDLINKTTFLASVFVIVISSYGSFRHKPSISKPQERFATVAQDFSFISFIYKIDCYCTLP